MIEKSNSKLILSIIVFAQFCCTSLWFASNAALEDLLQAYKLPENILGDLTSAVQFGFIVGTLLFAFLTISDRFSPSRVFFISAVLGAIFNLTLVWDGNTISSLLIFRALVGFFLAGIYPVGMKIAADYFEAGLGRSLSFLVGALVLGTAFPHFLKTFMEEISWKYIVYTPSILALIGGILMVMFVPDGPYRKRSTQWDSRAFIRIFRNKKLRAAAFGYFGHMWELYTFWAFVPVILKTYVILNPEAHLTISLWSFNIIAVGTIGCIAGGFISEKFGVKRTAYASLLFSGMCCLLVPFLFSASVPFFLAFLLFWGMVVISDSPLFSTLIAMNVASEVKGAALTIVNCIGFAITILSLQLLNYVANNFILETLKGASSMLSIYLYMLLALGPILGLLALRKKNKPTKFEVR